MHFCWGPWQNLGSALSGFMLSLGGGFLLSRMFPPESNGAILGIPSPTVLSLHVERNMVQELVCSDLVQQIFSCFTKALCAACTF
jgi:hypothetical protein